MTDTPLLQRFCENPEQVFDIEAELPSGVKLQGTVGPMLNGRILASLRVSGNPTQEDIEIAKEIMDQLMGGPAATVQVAGNERELRAAMRNVRRFMGGGVG